MKQHIGILTLLIVLCVSCGEYHKVTKSNDPELKYNRALQYFNDKQYVRAESLLSDVVSYYRGTDRAEDVTIYLARSYMGQKDYTSAAEYYEAYIRNYPKGKYAAEAYFQVGHCYYLDSPDARLDQDITNRSIEAFQKFIEYYPDNSYVRQAYQEQSEMFDKLAYKELLNARLYYNLGTYLGNNYLSCEITAKNALKNFAGNIHQEELYWLIFASKYQQMVYSVDTKKAERAREAEDEYYNFIGEYPNSKHLHEAERMYKEINRIVKHTKD